MPYLHSIVSEIDFIYEKHFLHSKNKHSLFYSLCELFLLLYLINNAVNVVNVVNAVNGKC